MNDYITAWIQLITAFAKEHKRERKVSPGRQYSMGCLALSGLFIMGYYDMI